jgi:hypothetical protein
MPQARAHTEHKKTTTLKVVVFFWKRPIEKEEKGYENIDLKRY